MRSGLGGWVRRYGPLEVAATLGALAAAGLVALVSDQLALAALAGTLGENLGFYACAGWRAARERLAEAGQDRAGGRVAHGWAVGRLAVVDLASEFGPAEILDTVLLRPALLYAATRATGSLAVGVLLGKLLADLVFYGIAGLSLTHYRRRCRTVTLGEVPNL